MTTHLPLNRFCQSLVTFFGTLALATTLFFPDFALATQLQKCSNILQGSINTRTISVVQKSVRNQCLGTCSLNAPITWLEYLAAKNRGKWERFSLQAILAEILIEHSVDARRDHWRVDEVTSIHDVFDVVSKAGVRPQRTFRPKLALLSSQRGLEFLIVKLSEMVAEDYRQHRDDLLVLPNGKHPYQDRIEARARQMVADLYGLPSETFVFENQTQTGLSYATSLGLPDPKSYREVELSQPKPSVQQTHRSLSERFRRDNLMVLDSVLEEVKALIDSDTAVLGSLHIDERYINDKTGLISKIEFHEHADNYISGGHSVVFVGYDLDENGKIRALILQNSWGDRAGGHGFFKISRDYFEMGELTFFLPKH